MQQRSGCPINLSIEALGDRWSLVIIRDIMFGDRRTFRDILTRSEEGIASNILAHRLRKLTIEGFVTPAPDPAHRQRTVYALTEKAIALVPVLAELGAWGRQFLPVTPALSVRAELLERGGPAFWQDFMEELRVRHLGADIRLAKPTASERLGAAFRAALEQADPSAPP
jgi:DNA-binding HxlR family transcriptional regulator